VAAAFGGGEAAFGSSEKPRQTRHDMACVGCHLARSNDMQVSGSRQLCIAVLVLFQMLLIISARTINVVKTT